MKRINSLLSMAAMMELSFGLNGVSEYPAFKQGLKSNRSKHSLGMSKIRTEPKIERNEICPQCDSGRKFKKCCGK